MNPNHEERLSHVWGRGTVVEDYNSRQKGDITGGGKIQTK